MTTLVQKAKGVVLWIKYIYFYIIINLKALIN